MEIISKSLIECAGCGYYKGSVDEKHNGIVPVFCYCDLRSGKASGISPSIIGFPDSRLFWKPISDYKNADGEFRHVPYFALGSSLPTPKRRKKR